MTAPAPWPLLDALDELLSREGWNHLKLDVTEMECRISDETGIKAPSSMALLWSASTRDWQEEPPFLRSRDAAAMLRDTLMLRSPSLYFDHTSHRLPEGIRHVYKYELYGVMACNAIEAAADTRAALGVGWKFGIWPVKP